MSANADRSAGIDLLRAISVFLVVLGHYGVLGEFILGGTHGVAIFFMVSGYCMAYSTRGRSGGEFLAARFWRLVPTLVLCATITALMEHVFGDINPGRTQTFKSYLANIACLSNGNLLCDLVAAVTSGQPIQYSWVDGAYWSLLVEMRYYVLLWFLLYVMGMRHCAVAIALLGLLAPLNAVIPLLSKGQDFLVYMSFFAFGMACRGGVEDRRLWLIAILAFIVFLENAWLGSAAISMDLSRQNVLSYALCFAIFLGVILVYRKGRNRVISWLGVISYPLYLLHQDIGLILIGLLKRYGEPVAIVAAILAVVALATAVNGLIAKIQPMVRGAIDRMITQRLAGHP